ncbi:MAG: hypothetical protein ACYCV7_15560 [Acidimicrobiales bacterium]
MPIAPVPTAPTPGARAPSSAETVPTAIAKRDLTPATGIVRTFQPEGFTIDCAECVHQHSSVCDDCVVSFLVDRQPEDAVVVDADEARAVRLLGQVGLVPCIRHSRKVG